VVVLRLKGLDCDECQPRAESEATSIEGVFQARANRAEGTLTVTFFTDKTDATEVESALASAGFEVAP
jgi:copper chaperone CopZ